MTHLVIHHSVDSNTYDAEAVPGLIKKWFGYHTATKGWADIAYNFMIDRFGGVWEAREGSLAGPVRTDATLGDPGSGQAICLLGDHRVEPPSPEALASLAALIGWLADRFALDLTPGAVASFTSRGSARFPKGRDISIDVVATHADLSATACPGAACVSSLDDAFFAVAQSTRPSLVTTTTVTTTTTAAPTTTAVAAVRTTPVAPATTDAPVQRSAATSASSLLPLVGAGAVVCGLATAVLLRVRRSGKVAAAEDALYADESGGTPDDIALEELAEYAPNTPVAALDVTGRLSLVGDEQRLISAESVVLGHTDLDQLAVDAFDLDGISVAVSAAGRGDSARLVVRAVSAAVRRTADGAVSGDIAALAANVLNAVRFQAQLRARETGRPAAQLLAPDIAVALASDGLVAFVVAGSAQVAVSAALPDGSIARRRLSGGDSTVAWPAEGNPSAVAQLAVVPQVNLVAAVAAAGPSAATGAIAALEEIDISGSLSAGNGHEGSPLVLAVGGLRALTVPAIVSSGSGAVDVEEFAGYSASAR